MNKIDKVVTSHADTLIQARQVKRRRDDLICLICGGSASCHNFGQISCHSCKEFFRRNGLLPIESTKCLNNDNRCEIRFDMKYKCQRCRLLKCFAAGMRKDRVVTFEEKLSKQQRIEENRRLRFKITQPATISSNESKHLSINNSLSILSDIDRSVLSQIENAYTSALKSSPSASSMISFDLSENKTLSFTTTTEIDQFGAIKLINFLRLIPEFETLVEQDRLLLVKYNLVILLVLRDLFIFDRKTGLWYDDNMDDTIAPMVKEKFAQCCKSLYILFYGYEEIQFYMTNISRVIDILGKDAITIQLLMLILLFQQGISINDEQLWTLYDPKRILHIHLEYIELLFRYLIDQYSFPLATIKMLRLVESIFRIQISAQRYRESVKERKDDHEVNPLLKSVLDIS